MTRSEALQLADSAHAETAAANAANTEQAHSKAASLHRIASEALKVSGDNELSQKHSDRAIEHSCAASRCHEAAQNHVGPGAVTAQPQAAALEAEPQAARAAGADGVQAGGPGSGRRPLGMSQDAARKAADEEHHAVLSKASGDAFKKSLAASKLIQKNPPATAADHDAAANIHEEAHIAHFQAARMASEQGNNDLAKQHMSFAGSHLEQKQSHDSQAAELRKGGSDIPTTGIAGGTKSDHTKSGDVFDASNPANIFSLKACSRMAKNAALQASVVNGGVTLQNLQDQVRQAVVDLPILTTPAAGNSNGSYCSQPWVCDVVAPSHEIGETWRAIVQGADGNLYAVEFTIGDGSVTVVGDPALVVKNTEYDYVDEIVNAKYGASDLALMAKEASCSHLNSDGTFKEVGGSAFNGCVLHMQAECGGGHSEESAKKICGSISANKSGSAKPNTGLQAANATSTKSFESARDTATSAGAAATEASNIAMESNDKDDHDTASKLHNIAATEHKVAAIRAHGAGNPIAQAYHATLSENHKAMADTHTKAGQQVSAPLEDPNVSQQPQRGQQQKGAVQKPKKPAQAADAKADICSLKAVERMNSNAALLAAVAKLPLKSGGPGSGRKAGFSHSTGQIIRTKIASEARNSGSTGLQASVSGGGWSLNDLQTNVREAIQSLPILNTPSEGNGNCGSCCWVTDLVAPVDDDDTWSAIVNACDGKLYSVDFDVDDDGEIELDGDPVEVARSTDYDYINDILNFADKSGQQGLEAAKAKVPDVNGGLRQSKLADMATEVADQLTDISESEPDESTLAEAQGAHDSAYQAHKSAYQSLMDTGADDDTLEHHLTAMQNHMQMSGQLKDNTAQLKSRAGVDPQAITELNASLHSAIASARAHGDALEAGDYPGHPFHGNQYGAGANTVAGRASAKAHEATKGADTAQEHKAAAILHRKAAKLQAAKGNTDAADYHNMMGQYHDSAAQDAKAKAPADHVAAAKQQAAKSASADAYSKSAKAFETDDEKDHEAATVAHEKAATTNKAAGNDDVAAKHDKLAKGHAGFFPGGKEHGGKDFFPTGEIKSDGSALSKAASEKSKKAFSTDEAKDHLGAAAAHEQAAKASKTKPQKEHHEKMAHYHQQMAEAGRVSERLLKEKNGKKKNEARAADAGADAGLEAYNALKVQAEKELSAGGPGSGPHTGEHTGGLKPDEWGTWSKESPQAKAEESTESAKAASATAEGSATADNHIAAEKAHHEAEVANSTAAHTATSNKLRMHFEKMAAYHNDMASTHLKKAFDAMPHPKALNDMTPAAAADAAAQQGLKAAADASCFAEQKTKEANESGSKAAHLNAVEANDLAYDAHVDACQILAKAGNSDMLDNEIRALAHHKSESDNHTDKANEIEAREARDAVAIKSCHDELTASGKNPTLTDVAVAFNAKSGRSITADDVISALNAGGPGSGRRAGDSRFAGMNNVKVLTQHGGHALAEFDNPRYKEGDPDDGQGYTNGAGVTDTRFSGGKRLYIAVHKNGRIAYPEVKNGKASLDSDLFPQKFKDRAVAAIQKNEAAKKSTNAADATPQPAALNAAATAPVELCWDQALNASAHVCGPIECSGSMVRSNGTEDGSIMFFPAGTHTITPSQANRPVTVCLTVDASAAEAMEAQRKALTAKGKTPFFSKTHGLEDSVFWPSKFTWDRRIDAAGRDALGVWADGMWTSLGKELKDGKVFRSFSPTFFVAAVTNDPSNPTHVVCNVDAKANMGSVENDPAFGAAISPLWAKNAS
jgi:hypothetical protein